MSVKLLKGSLLLDRFVLERELSGATGSHLWLALDRQLGGSLLLRLHASASERLRESIVREAERHRRLHHPHVARICDVHVADELVLTSILPAEGELLSARLAGTGPLPYRDVIEPVRPLVEALAHLHESGGEHGRLDSEHVLVDAASQWILLPADGDPTVGTDMTRLGDLMATLLTGGRDPGPDRSLNDLPDRLHAGRTLPALLDQLIGDLRAADAALRPSGMGDVITRLRQIEDVVAAPAPDPAPAPVVPVRPEPEVAGPRSRTSGWMVAAWVVVAIAAVIGAALVGRGLDGGGDEPGPGPAATVDPAPVEAPPAETPPVDHEEAARLAAARTAADEALGAALDARRRADEVGAAEWGAATYEPAAAAATRADAAYLEEQYDAAAESYREAASAFVTVFESRGPALERLLAEGRAALDAVDAEGATIAFRHALLIEPGREEAEIGLERAATIEELDRLLRTGRAHEEAGRLAPAHVEYAAAVALDARSERAAADLARIRKLIADEEFRALMARALEAYHRSAFDLARTRLLEARDFRPGAPEVAEALVMVDEARIRAAVPALRDEAAALEERERWEDAWKAYQRVLAIDAAVEFAQEGKTRCEEMIRVDRLLEHYLAKPDLLITDGSREDAIEFVDEVASLERLGPRMRRLHERLAAQVRLANTPLRVVIRSDAQTNVDVYRVGRYEPFEELELTLLPGRYTVVGHRRGYRDVRLELEVEPGVDGTTLTVSCTETIG